MYYITIFRTSISVTNLPNRYPSFFNNDASSYHKVASPSEITEGVEFIEELSPAPEG